MTCIQHIPVWRNSEPLENIIVSTTDSCSGEGSFTITRTLVCEMCGCALTEEMLMPPKIKYEPFDMEKFEKEKMERYEIEEKESTEPKKRWKYVPDSSYIYPFGNEPFVIAKTRGGALLQIKKEIGKEPYDIWWKNFA